jgi:hypothetical protein
MHWPGKDRSRSREQHFGKLLSFLEMNSKAASYNHCRIWSVSSVHWIINVQITKNSHSGRKEQLRTKNSPPARSKWLPSSLLFSVERKLLQLQAVGWFTCSSEDFWFSKVFDFYFCHSPHTAHSRHPIIVESSLLYSNAPNFGLHLNYFFKCFLNAVCSNESCQSRGFFFH